MRFTLVWSQQVGTKDNLLHVWKPVPASADFVALGMVATASPDPPNLDAVHCVPLKWTVPYSGIPPPRKLWESNSAQGRAVGLWQVRACLCVCVCACVCVCVGGCGCKYGLNTLFYTVS